MKLINLSFKFIVCKARDSTILSSLLEKTSIVIHALCTRRSLNANHSNLLTPSPSILQSHRSSYLNTCLPSAGKTNPSCYTRIKSQATHVVIDPLRHW